MPLIDIKSDLSARVTRVLNENEKRAEDSARLLKLLSGGKGIIFAANQAILDPKSAPKRLAAIVAQISLNVTGLGNHIGFDPNGPGLSQAIEGTAEERSDIRDRVSDFQTVPTSAKEWTPSYSNNGYYFDTKNSDINATYYVKSPLDKQVFIQEDNSKLRELDIVPFYFTSYKLSGGEVQPGPSLAFRSFFSSIQDTVNGNWSSFNYTGRGEMFYVYGSRARTMSFSFKTAAFNYEELTLMHEKVRKLKSFAAPTYNKDGYMQGNFYKLTIGDYIKDTPGVITSVGVTIADNVPWEVGERETILPHVLDITVQFTVLEDKTPEASFISAEDLGALDTFNAINGPGGI